MSTPEALEARIIELESLLAHQERLIDTLGDEILRLNQRYDQLLLRLENHEARSHALGIRTLAEEPPPPHY